MDFYGIICAVLKLFFRILNEKEWKFFRNALGYFDRNSWCWTRKFPQHSSTFYRKIASIFWNGFFWSNNNLQLLKDRFSGKTSRVDKDSKSPNKTRKIHSYGGKIVSHFLQGRTNVPMHVQYHTKIYDRSAVYAHH